MKNLSFIFSIILTFHAYGKLPLWSYDKGPVVPEKGCSQELYSMNCELIDLTARIPNMPALSDALYGRSQKFRPAFGPIPWRMRLEKDAVKILFMGQDGTHIAEAAGRPATAGFGGRAQDFANFLELMKEQPLLTLTLLLLKDNTVFITLLMYILMVKL